MSDYSTSSKAPYVGYNKAFCYFTTLYFLLIFVTK